MHRLRQHLSVSLCHDDVRVSKHARDVLNLDTHRQHASGKGMACKVGVQTSTNAECLLDVLQRCVVLHVVDLRHLPVVPLQDLDRLWQQWYLHELLPTPQAWIWIDGLWIPCHIVPEETVSGISRSDGKLLEVQFTVRLDIAGSPYSALAV